MRWWRLFLCAGLTWATMGDLEARPRAGKARGARERQAHQEERIDQGRRTGALTPEEAAKLEGRQEQIDDQVDAAKADGKTTRAERRAIRREQNEASREIRREKHDEEGTRPPRHRRRH